MKMENQAMIPSASAPNDFNESAPNGSEISQIRPKSRPQSAHVSGGRAPTNARTFEYNDDTNPNFIEIHGSSGHETQKSSRPLARPTSALVTSESRNLRQRPESASRKVSFMIPGSKARQARSRQVSTEPHLTTLVPPDASHVSTVDPQNQIHGHQIPQHQLIQTHLNHLHHHNHVPRSQTPEVSSLKIEAHAPTLTRTRSRQTSSSKLVSNPLKEFKGRIDPISEEIHSRHAILSRIAEGTIEHSALQLEGASILNAMDLTGCVPDSKNVDELLVEFESVPNNPSLMIRKSRPNSAASSKRVNESETMSQIENFRRQTTPIPGTQTNYHNSRSSSVRSHSTSPENENVSDDLASDDTDPQHTVLFRPVTFLPPSSIRTPSVRTNVDRFRIEQIALRRLRYIIENNEAEKDHLSIIQILESSGLPEGFIERYFGRNYPTIESLRVLLLQAIDTTRRLRVKTGAPRLATSRMMIDDTELIKQLQASANRATTTQALPVPKLNEEPDELLLTKEASRFYHQQQSHGVAKFVAPGEQMQKTTKIYYDDQGHAHSVSVSRLNPGLGGPLPIPQAPRGIPAGRTLQVMYKPKKKVTTPIDLLQMLDTVERHKALQRKKRKEMMLMGGQRKSSTGHAHHDVAADVEKVTTKSIQMHRAKRPGSGCRRVGTMNPVTPPSTKSIMSHSSKKKKQVTSRTPTSTSSTKEKSTTAKPPTTVISNTSIKTQPTAIKANASDKSAATQYQRGPHVYVEDPPLSHDTDSEGSEESNARNIDLNEIYKDVLLIDDRIPSKAFASLQGSRMSMNADTALGFEDLAIGTEALTV